MIKRKIQFSAQIKPDFINELRTKVKDYFETNHISKYGDLNMVAKTIFMLTIYIAPFILMLSGVINSPLLIFVCWIIMGFGMAGVGMGLMHDANHGTYSKNRTTNSLLGKSLFLLGGFPLTWQYQHNTLHHGFTNIEGYDEDIGPMSFLRFSPHKPLHKIHKYQYLYAWFFYGLMTLLWATLKDFKQLWRYKKMEADFGGPKVTLRQLYLQLIVSKILYHSVFLVIPLVFLPVWWVWIVLSFLTMHFICGFILGIIFQTAHIVPTSQYPLPDEKGDMENNWAIHQLITTSDYSPKSRIFSWLIGGLNYQVEHHLFPNISHVHYRKISLLVKSVAHKYGLPYHVQPSFIIALFNHAKMLKALGK